MIKYYKDSLGPEFFEHEKEKGRGAIVFGNPICFEVANFYDSSATQSTAREQLLTMFFAGTVRTIESGDLFDEDNF